MKTYDRIEAADFLKCDKSVVSDLFIAGKLPGAKIGRRLVFRDCDLEAYLSAQVEKQTGEIRVALMPVLPRGRPRRVLDLG